MKKNVSTKSYKVASWLKVFVVFLLIIIVVSSCQYDWVVPEPPKPEPDPVVEVTAYALPESISYADTTTLYWDSKNVASVTINETPVSISGSKKLIALKKDTTLVLKFVGYNGQIITKSVQITVASPIIIIPTRTDTICGRYWMLTKDSKYLSEGVWYFTNWNEDQLTRKTFFYKNGDYEVFKKDGLMVGGGKWKWIDLNSIKIGGPTYKYQLTDTTFIRSEREGTIIDVYKGYPISTNP